MKIHKAVKQIALVMHREENDCVILGFWCKVQTFFQDFFNSCLHMYLSFEISIII